MGRRAIQYDEKIAKQVEAMAAFGLTLDNISHVIGMNFKTMQRLYGEEWKRGKIKANAKVGERLYKLAVEDGNPSALIFWAKTQMGWRETQHIDHTSSDGTMSRKSPVSIDLSQLTPEQLTDMGKAFFRGKGKKEQ